MPGKPYSPDDEAYLERSVGVVPLARIARKLGRTDVAIKSKLYRMETPHSTGHGFLTANEAARCYDTSPHHVITLIKRGYLKARQQKSGRRLYLIDPQDAEQVGDLLRDTTFFYRGKEHSRTLLTEENVREIHRLKGKESYSTIARRFGVKKAVIAQVAQGRSWKHLYPRQWYERD